MTPRAVFRGRRDQSGVTIIEIIVVVAILGMVIAVAAPFFMRFTRRTRLKSAAFEVQSTLLAARIRAVNRDAPVSVVVTVATGAAPAHELDIIEPPIPTPPPPTPTPVINRQYFLSRREVDITPPPGNTISFGGDGRLAVPPNPTPGVIVVSGPVGYVNPNQITIQVDPSGRVRIITPALWN